MEIPNDDRLDQGFEALMTVNLKHEEGTNVGDGIDSDAIRSKLAPPSCGVEQCSASRSIFCHRINHSAPNPIFSDH